MHRLILAATALLAVQACQDSTSPTTSPHPTPSTPSAADEGVSAAAVRHVWAVVGLNGNLIRGSRVQSVTKLGTGQYEVTFNRNVSQCAYVATTDNAYSQALGVFTAGGHLSVNGVFVETKNQGGGLTDGPFNLVVACGPLSTRFAVVDYSGNLVRGTAGTTVTALGSGRYNVTFTGSVTACADIATVGDPGNALVFNPSGVYTGSGPDTRTVYVETKNPGGGLQSGVPFHLALICATTTDARYAVIRAIGTTQRGSVGTTSARSATGRYSATFNRAANTCAAVGTRGSVNTSVPFTPATIEMVPGPNANSIGIQIRKLLFFGGGFANQSFHAAIVC